MSSRTNFLQTLQAFKETRQHLIELWKEGIPSFCPAESQWNTWLQLHDAETLMAAVLKTTKRYNRLAGQMATDYLVRYMSSVANSLKRERAGAA